MEIRDEKHVGGYGYGGKNTLYGIDNTEISETVLKYQISDFP